MNQRGLLRQGCAPVATVLGTTGTTDVSATISSSLDWPDLPTRLGSSTLDVVGGNTWLASRLRAGMLVNDYRLVAPVGMGAQATVWCALRVGEPDRKVALKLLLPTPRLRVRQTARFQREAQRGMRVVDPGILTIEAYGCWQGILYMAMPLVVGCSLRELIRQRAYEGDDPVSSAHPLTALNRRSYQRAVLTSLINVVETLHAVHEARIAHRDIKPDNILLDARHPGPSYLCDFGLSRDLDVATPEQLRDGAGTPLYMAPEKLRHEATDEICCDIYAMGCTIYEAITLRSLVRVPRHLSQPAMLAFLARRVNQRRTIHPGPDCPSALAAVLARATSVDAQERHRTASELAVDLRAALATWSRRSTATHRRVESPPLRRVGT